MDEIRVGGAGTGDEKEDKIAQLRHYVDIECDDEKRITLYSKCNEQVKQLEKKTKPVLKQKKQQLKDLTDQLENVMIRNNWDCVPLNKEGSAYLRRVLVPPPSKNIVPSLIQEVIASLRDDQEYFTSCATTVMEDQRKRLATWMKNQRQVKRGKAGVEAALTTSRIDPPEPSVRFFGPGKIYPSRRLTPIGRPLTTREMLAEIIYVAIRGRHKPPPTRPAVERIYKFGRGKNDRKNMMIPDLAEVDEGTRSLIEELEHKNALCDSETCKAARDCEQYILAMKLCEDHLRKYVPTISSNGIVRKSMPMENGERSITLSVLNKPKPKRSATLWDVSELVDAALDEMKDLDSIPFNIHTAKALFQERSVAVSAYIEPKIAERLAAATKMEETLNICRGQLSKPKTLKRSFGVMEDGLERDIYEDAFADGPDEVLSEGDVTEKEEEDVAAEDAGAEDDNAHHDLMAI